MIVLAAMVALIAVVLLLPTVSDLVSLVQLLTRRATIAPASGPLPRLVFLVPAYNEELLVADCVRSLKRMRYPADRFSIVVIADNCTDRTAELAVSAGATCLVRNDAAHRGKPHAIAWALERLPNQAEAVVIVDADTVVDEHFAAALAEARPLAGKAVQVRNGVSNPTESAITRMAAVLASAKFEFQYRLKSRAGLNLPLGAGSCIGTEILSRYGWKAFSIGEDWEMYALLTVEGVRIDLAVNARLYAQEARSLKQVSSQRRRWTTGRLTVLSRYWRRILASRAIGPHQKLDTIAELLVPGPVVHLGLVTILGGGLLLAVPSFPRWVLWLLLGSVARPVGYCVAALSALPGRLRTLAAFVYLPIYAVWRLGVEAVALLAHRQKSWVRTDRHVPVGRSDGRRVGQPDRSQAKKLEPWPVGKKKELSAK